MAKGRFTFDPASKADARGKRGHLIQQKTL
jgi:hypothetical protein